MYHRVIMIYLLCLVLPQRSSWSLGWEVLVFAVDTDGRISSATKLAGRFVHLISCEQVGSCRLECTALCLTDDHTERECRGLQSKTQQDPCKNVPQACLG